MTKNTYRIIAIIILIMTIGLAITKAGDFLSTIFANIVLIVGSLISIVIFLTGNIKHVDEIGSTSSIIILVILLAIIFLLFLWNNFELSNSFDNMFHKIFEFFKAME